MPTGYTTGAQKHPFYDSWIQMKQRCQRPSHPGYQWYGARGITVDPMWMDFWTFVFDMGAKPTPAHSIDRIDNNGPYASWNCRWATPTEQSRNSAHIRLITYKGETMTGIDWARKLGIGRSAVSLRLKKYGEAHLFDTPVRKRGRRQQRPS